MSAPAARQIGPARWLIPISQATSPVNLVGTTAPAANQYTYLLALSIFPTAALAMQIESATSGALCTGNPSVSTSGWHFGGMEFVVSDIGESLKIVTGVGQVDGFAIVEYRGP